MPQGWARAEFRSSSCACEGIAVLLYDNDISGNCYKIRLLLAQLGMEFERRQLSVTDRSDRARILGRLNPALRVPTLVLDDGRPLAESNAILRYLARGTSMLSKEPYELAQTLQWLFFEQYSHEPNIAVVRFWAHSGIEPSNAEREGKVQGGKPPSRPWSTTCSPESSLSLGATPSPTSRSTPTRMSPPREGSHWSPTPRSGSGLNASPLRRGTSRSARDRPAARAKACSARWGDPNAPIGLGEFSASSKPEHRRRRPPPANEALSLQSHQELDAAAGRGLLDRRRSTCECIYVSDTPAGTGNPRDGGQSAVACEMPVVESM